MTASDLRSAIAVAKARAREALNKGEIPVGACVVNSLGDVISSAGNRTEKDGDQLSHAEVLCLSEASRATPGKRLVGCSLIVTLEPCLMCLGAAVNAGIERVYYLVDSPDSGAFTRYGISCRIEEHRLDDPEERAVIQGFFRSLR